MLYTIPAELNMKATDSPTAAYSTRLAKFKATVKRVKPKTAEDLARQLKNAQRYYSGPGLMERKKKAAAAKAASERIHAKRVGR